VSFNQIVIFPLNGHDEGEAVRRVMANVREVGCPLQNAEKSGNSWPAITV